MMYDMHDSMMHTHFHMKTLEASSSLNMRRAGSAWRNVGACGQRVSDSVRLHTELRRGQSETSWSHDVGLGCDWRFFFQKMMS